MGIAQTGLTDKTAVWLLTEAEIRLELGGYVLHPTGGIYSFATARTRVDRAPLPLGAALCLFSGSDNDFFSPAVERLSRRRRSVRW